MWTMLEGFQNLSAPEIDALIEAPVLITILVGAADGELDRQERYWADRLMRARTYSRPKQLHAYYRVVADNFLEKVDAALHTLPTDTGERSAQISSRLSGLNAILAKLDEHLAADIYRSFTGLAEETAEASGGFLRIGAISAAENQWYKLPMLTPLTAASLQEETEDED